MRKYLLLLPLLLLAGIVSSYAQMQPLPIDPKIKYGKLENGLTYYIRHNELPKNRADFYIAQNVGSVLEEDSQAGLAHFLEHMAFNGSKNYPGKSMLNYMESIGVKFGANINAYTGFDETVYNISDVPLVREGITDSCLLVLHDWSSFISLEDKEIDKERGVIREEMRSHAEASMRVIEKLMPQILPGSQYAKRLPIGTEQVIMNFSYDELKAYYNKWYRPDLQAIIIIGDIDPDQIEAKIKKMFADIPKPVNPAKRTEYSVDNNTNPLVGIATDKEATRTQISVDYKNDPMPKEAEATAIGLMMNYFKQVISMMINERFGEILNKANPPFIYAGGSYDEFFVVRNKDAWSSFCISKENGEENALKAVVRETERAKRFGFTPTEYERARTNVLKRYENIYNEREKIKNENYSKEYVDHFTKGGYIPGIESEYNMINAMAPQIPLEKINEFFSKIIGDTNVVISLTAPEKEGLKTPSKEQIIQWFNEVKAENIQAYEEKVITEPLLTETPKGGKITSQTTDKTFGTTSLTLSNGVKVVIKPTTFKDDEIAMSAISPGGSSLFPENDLVNIKLYESACNLGGLGSFSATDLPKVLAGKKVSVQPTIGITSEGLAGSSSPKDFETMLQLVYLHFTSPRMDEEAFESFIGKQKAMLESSEANPMSTFTDSLVNTVYKNTPRNARLKASDLKDANYQTIMNWRKERYKDASDFTFVFVGNIDAEKTKGLISQYLGSLPSINRKETFKSIEMGYTTGAIKNHFDKVVENPKATVFDIYTGTLQSTLSDRIKFDALQQILRIVYTEKVREDESGTYGVSVRSGISFYPKGQSSIQMMFETEPAKKDKLNEIIHRELKNLAQQGPKEEDLIKVKEYMLKKQQEDEQENGYWRSVLTSLYGPFKYDSYSNYSTIVQSLSQKDIRDITQKFISQGNNAEIIMVGVKSE